MNVADECAGCFRPIRDRFLLKVLDKPWHTGCVRCELCRKLLDEKCFYKEGKMYCKDDFYRSVSKSIYNNCVFQSFRIWPAPSHIIKKIIKFLRIIQLSALNLIFWEHSMYAWGVLVYPVAVIDNCLQQQQQHPQGKHNTWTSYINFNFNYSLKPN